jgi:hypothetical protein
MNPEIAPEELFSPGYSYTLSIEEGVNTFETAFKPTLTTAEATSVNETSNVTIYSHWDDVREKIAKHEQKPLSYRLGVLVGRLVN